MSDAFHPKKDQDQFELSFKIFYDLMSKRVSEILLVSSPYDAFTLEEDGRLAERIIHEYRGLNLTRPPRLTWVSSARQAINALSRQQFDLVLTMPGSGDMDPYLLGKKIKRNFPKIPLFLLASRMANILTHPKYGDPGSIDKIFVWRGNTDLLLALIKNVEDRMNVVHDTQRARVRVILMIEDSPIHYSSLLPVLYKEIVTQTQAVMEDSLNEEHRILRMRARPKILHAENFEDAENFYRSFKPYLLCVLSDVRFPRNDHPDASAGLSFLSMVKKEQPDIPLLLMSSEEKNRENALAVPAVFLNKNLPTLHTEIRSFFKKYLGFGDFIFKLPDGTEMARVPNLRVMEEMLPHIPDESVYYHAINDHFSTWLLARSEIQLASILKPVKASDFSGTKEIKAYLISCLHDRRMGRQKGVITDFSSDDFDPETDYAKLGKGSLGGKARGLAFMSIQLKENPQLHERFSGIHIHVPKTLVISTEGFDTFIAKNDLKRFSENDLSDEEIVNRFLSAQFPESLSRDLIRFLEYVKYPLAIRSSSLLEDAIFQPFAGIYNTYMIPNNHNYLNVRLDQLIQAIKLVYASTFLQMSRSYAKSTLHRTEEEKMGVVIQKLTGAAYGNFFYPAVSGIARSYNFYPIAHMDAEDGIAHIALGFGKTVVEGYSALRFSPRHPQYLPQFSSVEDILAHSQRYFYAMKLTGFPEKVKTAQQAADEAMLVKIEVVSAAGDAAHTPIRQLSSTYSPDDHRIRDTAGAGGYPVITFANILKYNAFPLPEILTQILEIGKKGMASPVEIEFAVHLPDKPDEKPEFSLLQIRPMALSQQNIDVEIQESEVQKAFCFSTMTLGHGTCNDIEDIVFVDPDTFDSAKTGDIAREIGTINKKLVQKDRKYLLIGPGRWGSADRWLGIPVTWNDISGVGYIIENRTAQLRADPSQGSHFFQNITSLGIGYLTVTENSDDFIDWTWLKSLPFTRQTTHLKHVQLDHPMMIKIDGKKSRGVMLKKGTNGSEH